jgi:hypothetical protein
MEIVRKLFPNYQERHDGRTHYRGAELQSNVRTPDRRSVEVQCERDSSSGHADGQITWPLRHPDLKPKHTLRLQFAH